MSLVLPVVLCGGSGSRLWPLSRPDRPKPVLSLCGERSLLADTAARLTGPGFAPPWVICGASHEGAIRAELPGARVLVEPSARGTGAAVVGAASLADPEQLLLAVPADHRVTRPEALRAAVQRAAPIASAGWIVTFGVVPTGPATGYGWIEPGEALGDGVLAVARFLEKPDRATAEALLASGRTLWNSGMFLFRAGALLEEVDRWAPGLRGLDPIRGSIDVLLMERTRKAAVVPVDCGWSDLGTWGAVAEARAGAPSGEARIEGSPGTLVYSDGPPVAVLGAPGLVVVASADGVLVASPEEADRCAAMGFPAERVVDRGPGWEVRRIRLGAGEAVDLAEVSVLVSGELSPEARPGGTLAPGRWVAVWPSVVVTVSVRPPG